MQMSRPINIGGQMLIPRVLLLLPLLGMIGLLCGGCEQSANSAAATTSTAPTTRRAAPITPPSTQMTTLTGTLRGGMMAIGGETTGWVLVGDGATGGTDLDVSRVEADAKRLEGKRVNVTGKSIDKKYVERGTVRVLQVEKIEAAK
jgi:hypothetical protein